MIRGTVQAWEQQPSETDKWYGRFQIYLNLGPMRTVARAYLQAMGEPPESKRQPSTDWKYYATQARWRERAQAWDAYQRNLLALSERNLRLGLRNRRIDVMEDTLEVIREALDRARLAEVECDEARALLPQLRVFLRDMLVAQRQEFERVPYEKDDPACATPLTADDLRAAQRVLEEQAAARSALMAKQIVGRRDVQAKFYVCTPEDGEQALDLPALQKVRAATGLQYKRVLNPTQRKLYDALRRQRNFGLPVEYLHVDLRATAEGIEFGDGLADVTWLGEKLKGVRVLLLARCAGHSLGKALAGVPFVVTVSEEMGRAEAAAFCREFWKVIGEGAEPGEALEGALAVTPPAARGCVLGQVNV